MISLIGYDIEKAKNECDLKGLDVIIVPYSSLKGVSDSDKSIVVKQKLLNDKTIELIVCDFKTKLKFKSDIKS